MFIKIKQFPKLYLLKLRIRIFKNFVKTILYLCLIGTPQILIRNFFKNFFIHNNIGQKYTNFSFLKKTINLMIMIGFLKNCPYF